ncbi:MAG: hypothetical protein JKY17_08625 [Magnetovibrio sp.]|nr:hypothetical protein [Magnetovibrio sp.]
MNDMRKSRKQDRLLEHFVAGTTARYAASLVNVNFKTRASYFQRLREIIAYPLDLKAGTVFAARLKSMKATLAASVRGSVAEMPREKSPYLAFKSERQGLREGWRIQE